MRQPGILNIKFQNLSCRRDIIDTCIWIDYEHERTNGIKDLGRLAERAMRFIIESGGTIIISNLNIKEFSRFFHKKGISNLRSVFRNRIEIYESSMSQMNEAEILAKNRNLPESDVLHAIIARDAKAILVTRDKHFLRLKDISFIRKPEDLI